MVLPIKVYVIAASLGTIVYLAILLRGEITAASNTICALSPTRKFALAVMLLIAVAFGGTKTNQVNQAGGTNDATRASSPRRLPPPGPSAAPSTTTATASDMVTSTTSSRPPASFTANNKPSAIGTAQ